MVNQSNATDNVDAKMKKLKLNGVKNVSLLNNPSSEDMKTLVFVDEAFSKLKTVVNIDGKLEIYIEKK